MMSRESGGRRREEEGRKGESGGGRYRTFFDAEFPSTFTALGDTLPAALKALRDQRWITHEQEFLARLCLEEALVNAIVHGNKFDESRKVRMEMAEEGDLCRIRVYDEGSGFVPGAPEMPDCRKPNGRGLCLIRHCMETVRFDNQEKCLEMTMRRRPLHKEGDIYGGTIASQL